MDVSQYLEIFIDEAKEHLQSLNEQLLILEKEPDNEDTINEIFRAAHSLKGMAGTMGYKKMQQLTHNMENVFSEIRAGNMTVKARLVDILFKGLDVLENQLKSIQESSQEGEGSDEMIIKELNQILADGIENKEGDSQPDSSLSAAVKQTELSFTDHEKMVIREEEEEGKNTYGLRVTIAETCILKAARAFLVFRVLEDMGDVLKSSPGIKDIEDEKFELEFEVALISDRDLETVKKRVLNVSEIRQVDIHPIKLQGAPEEKPISKEPVKKLAEEAVKLKKNAAVKNADKKMAKPLVNRSVRVDIEKLDVLMNLVSELIIAKNGLVSMNSDESTERKNINFNEQIEYLERVTTNLHETVMKVRMVPIESVANRFPRMIRDLNKKLGKKMELYMTGEDTELDRTVIDEIGDPLMHLLRNAADHGLESNEERVNRGKPETGSIFLDAYQDGNNVVIEVRDDGGGINTQQIKKKALEKGTISEDQAEGMTEKDYIELLFKPSFSTAEKISDVSGRGVGLDVVKNKIEGLGGSIECKTELGKGSAFIIRLPLTLAIIQALMVKLEQEKYAIPLGNIQTIEDIKRSDIRLIQTKEVISLRGMVIPLIRLKDVLDVEYDREDPESLTVVIVAKGERYAGLVVDALMGQQEIVIKSIGKYIYNNKIISGATILGDGEVALIVDSNTMV